MYDPRVKLTDECPHRSMEPTAREKENGKLIQYWSCPIKLVHKSVHYWFQQYEYETAFPGTQTPAMKNRPRRYLLMYNYYNTKLQEYMKIADQRRTRGG